MYRLSLKKIESCVRCGACCERGGPTLHSEDRTFLQKGVLRPTHLFTLRAGELAYHPLEERLIELSDEMIKIKGMDGSSACIFYDAEQHGCAIYEDRPLECRALKCWDTRDVEGLFMQDLLSRLVDREGVARRGIENESRIADGYIFFDLHFLIL